MKVEGTPRVSILMPVWNASECLHTCLRSIVRQSETRWECIIVDDGSRDGSLEILAAAARRDPRFRIVSRPHGGIVAALCAGLDFCRAPFVARMDADDWMHRDRLTAQLALFERRPELAAVGARVRIQPRTDLTPGRRAYEAWLNGIAAEDPDALRREAFVECPIAHPTLMIRREVLVDLGYRDMGWPEDYDLVLRCLAAGHALAVHGRRLVGWRDSPGRLSRSSPTYSIDRFTACKAAHLAGSFLADSDRYTLWGYGGTGRSLRRALAEWGRRPSHIVELHPRRIGNQIHGAPVIAPEALAGLPRRPLVVSVAGAGPRERIRAALHRLGFEESIDFVCAA
jgi:glycosyltransferase involved in cell wall biosynthesis